MWRTSPPTNPDPIARCCDDLGHRAPGPLSRGTGVFARLRLPGGQQVWGPVSNFACTRCRGPSHLTDRERALAMLDAAAFDFAEHRRNLAAMRVPTMVAWATDDPIISTSTFQALADMVPAGPWIESVQRAQRAKAQGGRSGMRRSWSSRAVDRGSDRVAVRQRWAGSRRLHARTTHHGSGLDLCPTDIGHDDRDPRSGSVLQAGEQILYRRHLARCLART